MPRLVPAERKINFVSCSPPLIHSRNHIEHYPTAWSKHPVVTRRPRPYLPHVSSVSNSVAPAKLSAGRLLCLGLEGSANKLGAGIISHSPSPSSSKTTTVTVLSNVRHTYITPPGEGFLPSDTARHHREWVVKVIKECVRKAGIRIEDLDCIAFTKGKRSAEQEVSDEQVRAWGHRCKLEHWWYARYRSCTTSLLSA